MDFFRNAWQLIQGQFENAFVNIPITNGLSFVYVILNFLLLLFGAQGE